MQSETKQKIIPLSLCIGILILDQITKLAIVHFIPLYSIGASFFGDFLRIIHVTNTGAAFSLGGELPHFSRMLTLGFLPLAVLIGVIVMYFKSNDFTRLQRWVICGIVGGGFGNLIDRFFRPLGVVDFIDVKFYGLLGMERWPTFNVADMAVVICGFLLLISTFKKDESSK